MSMLDRAPRPLVESERSPEDHVVLLRPKFRRGPLARWLQPRLRRPYFRLELDEIGTFVWDRLDGQTTVAAIADAARARFGARIEPVNERVGLFLRQLEQGKFISIP